MIRSTLLWTHKYTGLFLGLLLSLTGLSGSLIVFDRELDELLDSQIADFSAKVAVGDIDLALSNAKNAVDNGSNPTRIALGRDASAPHIIRFPAEEGAVGPVEVTTNPNTGEVTSVRTWGAYPVTWIYRFHYSLLGGETGETVVGILGVALILFCLSGIVIWWPRFGFSSIRQLKHAFSVRLNKGTFFLNLDLHRFLGVVFMPLLFVIAFTGLELVWHEPIERMIAIVLPVEHRPTVVSKVPSLAMAPMAVNEIHERALQTFPASRVSRIYFPKSATDVFQVTMIREGERWREFGATQLWLDQYSGAEVGRWDSKHLSSGNLFLEWMFPLHNGDALGMAGRVAVFFGGLLPAFFFGSGLYLWLRKRNLRKKAYSQGGALQSN